MRPESWILGALWIGFRVALLAVLLYLFWTEVKGRRSGGGDDRDG